METMNYDRISKKRHNMPLISICIFILVGSSFIAYSLISEQAVEVIGSNALIDIYSENTSKVNLDDYELRVVELTPSTSSTNNYSANIHLPKVYINDIEFEDYNDDIKKLFINRYDALMKDGETTLENTFVYNLDYKTYESEFDENKLFSIVLNERIVSGGTDVFSNKYYTYTIDVISGKILTQTEVAPIVLSYSYRNRIKEQVKNYFVTNNYVSSSDYTYYLTGLEEFYVKDGEMHIVFNPSQGYNNTKNVIDIIITK